MTDDKKCDNGSVQRQPMNPAIVTLNCDLIKRNNHLTIKNQYSKNNGLCCNHNNDISSNACKKLNIPTNCKLYKNLVNLESMTLSNKPNNQIRLKKDKIITIVKDLEPKIDDYEKLEKYKYLLNPVGEDIYPEIKKKLQNANSKNAQNHQSTMPLRRSHFIEKIHEWNSLIES